jgi:hypothetical protein
MTGLGEETLVDVDPIRVDGGAGPGGVVVIEIVSAGHRPGRYHRV